MMHKKMFSCYQFNGDMDDFVGHLPFVLDPLNVAASSQKKLIEYLAENEGKEVRREYYNNNDCVKIEIERNMMGKVVRRVYVIIPVFVLDEAVEAAL
jgi:hypothetical protein